MIRKTADEALVIPAGCWPPFFPKSASCRQDILFFRLQFFTFKTKGLHDCCAMSFNSYEPGPGPKKPPGPAKCCHGISSPGEACYLGPGHQSGMRKRRHQQRTFTACPVAHPRKLEEEGMRHWRAMTSGWGSLPRLNFSRKPVTMSAGWKNVEERREECRTSQKPSISIWGTNLKVEK